MKNYICFILCLIVSAASAKQSGLSRYINPFIGASTSVGTAGVYHGLGKTFPGATTPFSMVQVSPNTITGSDLASNGDHASGYSYEHRTIEGFAFMHMSGTGWYGDLGNFLVMPTTGELRVIAGREDDNRLKGWRSTYDKDSEQASAGYYSVRLTDYDIKTECTATSRSGALRFTFPKNELSRIQIDLARRIGGTSVKQYVEVVDAHTIKGWMLCTPEGGGWGNGTGQVDYTAYFYARFSKPLKNYGFWSADIPDDWVRKRNEVTSHDYLKRVSEARIIRDVKQLEGKHIGFFTEFDTQQGEQVELNVGISFVDMQGAENNFRAEAEGLSFDKIHDRAVRAWDDALNVIEIETPSDELKTIFYTSLYHTMVDPRIISDVDGRYYGGGGKTYHSNKFQKRTIFSGWDVFRSQFPLQTIINPKMINDQINSMVTLAEQSGNEYFERWELLNAYSGCMAGNPALSVLTDAYMKGIRDYDVDKAYKYALNTSNKFSSGERGYCTDPIGISNTLEYAYADWCVGVLAKELGDTAQARILFDKGQSYRNIFNSATGWFQPRTEDGAWIAYPKNGRIAADFGCIESNPYQQGWFVPHDVDGMVALMGGTEVVKSDLENFFAKAPSNLGWNDYYNHANEPVHHVPFLFNRVGAPWLTQKWTRHICQNGYHNSVEGLVGNEDEGQMSAWYVLASMGIHPVCPGDTRYELTSPMFDRVTINLADGKKFTLTIKNNSPENIYIQNATLNGKPYVDCFIDHKDITRGGELLLEMGDKPGTDLR